MRSMFSMLLGCGLLAFTAPPSHADGAGLLKLQCGSCHALTTPTDTSLDRIWSRNGPDLYYAGVKFNRDWLVQWLQDPKPIRPAGYPYFKNVIQGKEHDEVDKAKLTPHMHLSKQDADAAANALMALNPEGIVDKGLFKGDKPNMRMGALSFNKLRGCAACHEGDDGQGGLSGPELTDAGKRLQADFIASYIKNPQKIDPHVWMPALKMTDQDIQRLTGYLVQLGTEEKK